MRIKNQIFLGVALSAAILLLGGCGSLQFVPVEPRGNDSSAEAPDLQSYRSLHFVVYGYDMNAIMKIAVKAEDIYKKVMFDTNLMSFKPRENYKITVHRTAEEYQRRTGYPSWSGGGAATKPLGQVLPGERDLRARTSIVTFESALSSPLLAHELTHLVFNEFMAFETSDDMAQALWLNEGLATFEEMEYYDEINQKDFVQVTRSLVKRDILPISELVAFRPMQTLPQPMGKFHFMNQPVTYTNIDLWYWHVRFLTEFLIQREGRYSFYVFMSAIKGKKKLADALQDAYPGKWRSLGELESEWRQWL